MSVSTSTIHQHCVISIMPFIDLQCVMGQNIGDLYCVTNIIFCIDRHCVISVMTWIKHYCVVRQNIGDIPCVINVKSCTDQHCASLRCQLSAFGNVVGELLITPIR